jgi:hypothetical protein
MLSPDDRTLLVDLLAPPQASFRLEHAVATTFTLDLEALLPVPLGLAGADLVSSADPLAILQSIRSYGDRIDIFCQAGHVSIPTRGNDLMTFLESMVHQVKAPRSGHLFHPKLWALRYVNDDGEERFRLVCGSRNLTTDRAWDAVISLEGRRTARPYAVNRPLADFIRSLADRVPNGLKTERRGPITELAEALRYVEWERPDDVVAEDWLTFHVFGTSRRNQPDMSGYSRLVVSPFLNNAGLDEVWPEQIGDCVVVSRAEELDAIGPEGRHSLEKAGLRVLDESAAIPDPESDEAGLRWSLSGLHAKVYIVERDKKAHVFVGSANMTDAAWAGNDELLVEIVGKVSTHGVLATLGIDDGGKGSSGFDRILIPHVLGVAPTEPTEIQLRRVLENALRDLASITYTGTVEGSTEAPALIVRSEEPLRASASLPEDVELTFGLLTIPGQLHRAAFGVRLDHRWQLSRVEEITPFLVIRLSSGIGASRVEVGSVVLAGLVGDPTDRLDRVLAQRIGTPSEFLRFLLLLLQLAGRDGFFPEGLGGGIFGAFNSGASGPGLLEEVLSALASAPNAIDDVDRLAKQLSSTEQGHRVLPPGWVDFWAPVMAARSRLRAKR